MFCYSEKISFYFTGEKEVKALMRRETSKFQEAEKNGSNVGNQPLSGDKSHNIEGQTPDILELCGPYHTIDKSDPEQNHEPKQNRFWHFIKSLRKANIL